MRLLSRSFPVALLGAIVAATACGGDATGPRAGSITGIAGDGQSAPTGTVLPIPLSFIVLSPEGSPLPNATVTWQVATGTATVNPTSSKTDSTGFASTTVTLGTSVGPVVVRASVSGVAPVNFNITALDPCDYNVPYTFASTVNGALTTTDCHVPQGYFYDYYEFSLGAQQGLTATMSAASFDAYLDLYGGTGPTLDIVGFDDDISQSNLNAQIQAIVAPGTYVLGANSALQNRTGSYSLSTATRAQTIANCEVIFVTRGVVIGESIATTDCQDSIAGGIGYGDAVGIIARAGSVLTLSERSTAVDPMLTLYRVDSILNLVASNDDSAATTTTAFLSYPVTLDAVYVIFVGTDTAGATGAYTLDISSSATAAGVASMAPAPLTVKPLLPAWWTALPRARRKQ